MYFQLSPFEEWKIAQRTAGGGWETDVIHYKPGDIIAFCPDHVNASSGFYVCQHGVDLFGGRYEGAVSNIGDAIFHTVVVV